VLQLEQEVQLETNHNLFQLLQLLQQLAVAAVVEAPHPMIAEVMGLAAGVLSMVVAILVLVVEWGKEYQLGLIAVTLVVALVQ
jgi:hypothetical protein